MDRLVSSPVFIFSPPGSGSTLLRCVLGSHSRIHAPPELHLDLFTVPVSHKFVPTVLDVLGMTTRELEHLLWDRMLHHELVRSGKQVLVEKTPDNVRFWRRIAECWPDAKFIFLIRHPVHIAAGPIDVFGKVVGILAILEWARFVDEARAELVGPTVRYEDLTARPAEVIRELCAFLEVPWEPDMLDYGRFDHGPFARGLGDWGEKLRSGRIQPPRAMPAPAEIPAALKACCQSWGYLDSPLQQTSTA
ncbi:MAG: sulfotransferase family protein [Egibacteraceae bacterium]